MAGGRRVVLVKSAQRRNASLVLEQAQDFVSPEFFRGMEIDAPEADSRVTGEGRLAGGSI